MKLKPPTKYFIFIFLITLLFCLAIAFDITPYLRGPAPYPPEWRWEYLFVNTISKIYVPLICIFFLIGIFLWEEKKNFISHKSPLIFFILIILLGFLFKLCLLYFSRSGVLVLVHRIINPDLNSYFTASLQITNPIDFLKNYESEMKNFVYHARSHPPAASLIFYGIKQLIAPFPFFVDFVNKINPTHSDVRQIWNILLPIDRATAVFAAFFIPFLSTITIVPLYYVGKILYGTKVAVRSSLMFILLPGVVLFVPINDIFLPLFSVSSFLFLLKGLQKNSLKYFFISGVLLFVGAFFSLSLLPLVLLFFIFALLHIYSKNLNIKNYLKGGIIFALGFVLIPILLYIFFNFNSIRLIQIIFSEVPHVHSRSYPTWLFYNIYDFLIFVSMPLAVVFLTQIKKFFFSIFKKQWIKNDLVFISFLIMLVIVDLSGSTRGETGRIWSIFMPFLLLPAVYYLTNIKKFSSKLFAGTLFLLAFQLLVMQEFWVMLW